MDICLGWSNDFWYTSEHFGDEIDQVRKNIISIKKLEIINLTPRKY